MSEHVGQNGNCFPSGGGGEVEGLCLSDGQSQCGPVSDVRAQGGSAGGGAEMGAGAHSRGLSEGVHWDPDIPPICSSSCCFCL